jgi:hypothetical protein
MVHNSMEGYEEIRLDFFIIPASVSPFFTELITNTPNRNTISLNGSWNYIMDPYETGYYNYRHEPFDQVDKGSVSVRSKRPI